MRSKLSLLAVVAWSIGELLNAGTAFADQARIRMTLITSEGIGATIGTIQAVDTKQGLRLTPLLKSLSPGAHGIHIHEKGDCEPGKIGGTTVAGGAAGGHFDPDNTGKHEGPTGMGHLGDLPVLTVGADGIARTPITAPRLKLAQIKGRAIVIHAGGDNYSDQPEPLGGGGMRVACGVIR